MNISFLRTWALAASLSLSVLGVPGSANAAEYTSLDSEASSLKFGYSQMNVTMDGSFGTLRATDFRFDPAKPGEAKVSMEVALDSIDAGYAEANTELEKEEWLATPAHPLATFVSKKVEPLGGDKFQVTGDLSIKGKTQEVTAPFTFTQEGDSGIFQGSFTFQRTDYGIGEGQWKDVSIVADDIQITFHLVARP